MKLSTSINTASFLARIKNHEKAMEKGFDKGLGRWAVAANLASKRLLSGSGKDAPSAYPVPVRTGFLRKAQDYILPNQKKGGIKAGKHEAILVNGAEYAVYIHDKHPFAQDGIDKTRSAGMQMISASLRQAMMGV